LALSNSFGFGGTNGTLVFAPIERLAQPAPAVVSVSGFATALVALHACAALCISWCCRPFRVPRCQSA